MRDYLLLLTVDRLSIHFDEYFSVLHQCPIGLDRDHAGRRDHLARLDVELAVVEVALDDVAIDKALRQRTRAMGARIVGNEELAIKVEDREGEPGGFDFERAAGRNLTDLAEFDACRHRL